MKRITLNLIAFACAIAAPHLACAQTTCPPTLVVGQKTSVPAPDWTVTYSGYNTAIAGVTIFEGPPAEQASLVPDREQTTIDTVIQTWKLAKSGRGYWPSVMKKGRSRARWSAGPGASNQPIANICSVFLVTWG